MRTRAPQNRGGCVQAGPVRFSRREPPWRTMFAATVSAGCKHLAARLPQHPPFGIRPRPCSGAQRAPQNADPFAAKPRRGHVPAGPVRPSPDERPWRTMFAATVSAGCKRLAARLPQHPPFGTPVAAHSVRHEMRTRAPQNRGGCVQAGPVRFSRREPPWRTMFAATVSAGCKHLAARLPQHPPFGIRPRPCSGAQRAPQNADPCATKPRRGMRSGRPGAFLVQGTAMANNVRRYGLGILYALRQPCTPCSGAHCAPQNADPCTAKPPN